MVLDVAVEDGSFGAVTPIDELTELRKELFVMIPTRIRPLDHFTVRRLLSKEDKAGILFLHHLLRGCLVHSRHCSYRFDRGILLRYDLVNLVLILLAPFLHISEFFLDR